LKSTKIRESKEVARGVGKWDAKVEGMGGWGSGGRSGGMETGKMRKEKEVEGGQRSNVKRPYLKPNPNPHRLLPTPRPNPTLLSPHTAEKERSKATHF